MHKEVVVHLVPNVLESQLTVVIVGVHFLSHWLVELLVEETENFTTCLGSLL